MSGQKERKSENIVGGRRNLSLPIVKKRETKPGRGNTHKEKDLSTSVLDDKLIAFFFHNIPSPEKIVFA